MADSERLRALLMKANRDPAFRQRFLENPEAIAKEMKTPLSDEIVAKLGSLQRLIDELEEIEFPVKPDPIFYPVMKRWKVEALTKAVREMGIRIPPQEIFYPAERFEGMGRLGRY